jgi:2-oxoglutarate dehydrogenase E2 component (dihydrolipoamide succinyltransferase)
MAIEIKVPSLGESVSEATIGRWLVKEGDYVKADQMLVELETDKVTLEVNAVASGILKALIVKEGDVVAVGAIIGLLDEEGVPVASAAVSIDENKPKSGPKIAAIPSPAAEKIAKEQKIDLTSMNGTGKDGRITKQDVLEKKNVTITVSEPSEKQVERVRMSRLRQRIAERLKDSQNTAAILTTFNEIDMTNVIALRNQYKDVFEKKHKVKLGFMSFFVKAAVTALKEIPAVNAEIDGQDIIYKNYYDIGVAVGTEQGLVVPVVRQADQRSFADVELEIANLGKKAREGKLTIADLSGGTFTVSNGGVYGSLMSTPIINPPQSGILGMHKTQDRPVAVNGQVEIRPMMYIALSYDHRLIDGKEAVTFLVRVKEIIEDPKRLLLDL